jgi:hypothetical protein
MDNADLLRQLGWSDDLIQQVSEVSKALPKVPQLPVGQVVYGADLTGTTTSAICSLDVGGTYNNGFLTV